MSNGMRDSTQLRVALVTPPSDVDYGASIASAITEHTTDTTINRYDPTGEPTRAALADHDFVLVGGSTTRVADSDPWIDELATTMRALVDDGTPVLGVCFGHQLLAESMGGTVDTLPTRAAGYRDIERTTHGLAHPLFSGFPRQFTSFVWHRDHVTVLPPDAVPLARNSTGIQAFACEDRLALGIQFHPEVGLADARTLVTSRARGTLSSDVRETLTDAAASRAARTRRLYGNAVMALKRPDSRD